MILIKELNIKIGNLNFKYYKDLGYKFSKVGDLVRIDIDHLTKGSKSIIDISCDYCGIELKVPYKRYNRSIEVVKKYSCSNKLCSNQKIKDVCLIKYNVENPFQAQFVKDKSKETLISRYGVEHPMYSNVLKDRLKDTYLSNWGVDNPNKLSITRDKIKNTCLEKYGVEHPSMLDDFQAINKETRIRNGNQISDDLLTDYQLYRREVDNLTNRLKGRILEDWDGHDYYDGEYIKDNFKLSPYDRDYPHFDHKNSVIYGLKHKIPASEIADINNICITKQWINCKKGYKSELEYKEKSPNN